MASEPGRKRGREMEPEPRRKRSKQLPPDLSELMNKLIKEANSFIQQFNIKESRMREIVRELRRICEKVKEMQKVTDTVRTAGAVGGGITLAVGIVGAFFTGGASLALCGAAAAAAGGGGAVAGSNVYKMWSESGSAEKVEKLGKEFKQIVEQLKRILEEIQETCEKLEDKAAEYQSGNALTNMKEFEEILRRVSELKEESLGAVHVAVLLIQMIGNMLTLVVDVFRVTATHEKDRELREAIIQSADQSKKVVDEFKKTKTHLEEILNL